MKQPMTIFVGLVELTPSNQEDIKAISLSISAIESIVGKKVSCAGEIKSYTVITTLSGGVHIVKETVSEIEAKIEKNVVAFMAKGCENQ
jgi:hypothetical protein